MRNLIAHPLTNEEVLDWLSRQELAVRLSLRVGSTDGVIIQHLRKLVLSNPITTETDTTTAKD